MNIANVVAQAIGNVAPTVAGALGGPLAGKVVQEVSRAVTGRPDPPEPVLRDAVKDMTPEARANILALEKEFTERLRISAADRANARERQITTGDRVPAILALLAFVSLIATGAALFFFDPTGGARDILMSIVGALIVMAKQGYDFFLGSTTDSRRKTGIMAGMTR